MRRMNHPPEVMAGVVSRLCCGSVSAFSPRLVEDGVGTPLRARQQPWGESPPSVCRSIRPGDRQLPACAPNPYRPLWWFCFPMDTFRACLCLLRMGWAGLYYSVEPCAISGERHAASGSEIQAISRHLRRLAHPALTEALPTCSDRYSQRSRVTKSRGPADAPEHRSGLSMCCVVRSGCA